jgi:ABC-type transport system involved in multi-copper enzyme maturation permease subunit
VTRILSIAQVTWREAVRDRVLYSVLFFTATLFAVAGVLDHMTLGQSGRVVLDLGLAGIHLCGAFIAVFLPITLLSRDIARKTLHVVLAKPVGRTAYLAGKYLGLVFTEGVIVAVMGLVLAVPAAVLGQVPGLAYAAAVAMIWVELAVLTGIAMLFAAITGPFLAGMFTLGLFLIGHLSRGLETLGAESGDPLLASLSRAVHLGLPDLAVFDLKPEALYGTLPAAADVGLALAYGAACTVALIAIASLVFARRDFR